MKIGVIGLGKLGLPLALVFAKAGYEVLGLDISQERLEIIKGLYKAEAKEPRVTEYLQKYRKNLQLASEYHSLKDVPLIIIITQSPSLSDGSFDSSFVEKAVKDVHSINKDALIVISTTTNLGTIDDLSKIHKKLCYNPEMIKQGSIIHDYENPKFVVIGAYEKEDGEQMANVWRKVHDKPIYFVSPIEAEILKLSLNVSFNLGITFANLIGELCESYDANSDNVLDILYKDRRNYKPGLGFMGPCFPRDAVNFERISSENSLESGYRFGALLTELNNYTVERYAKKIKTFNKIKLGVLGIGYKPNTPYTFESQPIKIIQLLLNENSDYKFYIYDPMAEYNGKKELDNENVHFCSTIEECLKESEIVFIGTANYSNIETSKIKIDPWTSGRE